MKARFTLPSKQAKSHGCVVDMEVFQLCLLKNELSLLSETWKTSQLTLSYPLGMQMAIIIFHLQIYCLLT